MTTHHFHLHCQSNKAKLPFSPTFILCTFLTPVGSLHFCPRSLLHRHSFARLKHPLCSFSPGCLAPFLANSLEKNFSHPPQKRERNSSFSSQMPPNEWGAESPPLPPLSLPRSSSTIALDHRNYTPQSPLLPLSGWKKRRQALSLGRSRIKQESKERADLHDNTSSF